MIYIPKPEFLSILNEWEENWHQYLRYIEQYNGANADIVFLDFTEFQKKYCDNSYRRNKHEIT